MTALIPHSVKIQIAEKLINGESLEDISKCLKIRGNSILTILGDPSFSAKLLELFRNQARGLALLALHNITRIAFEENKSVTAATKLKASKMLADIALQLDEIQPGDLDPSSMSQSQLVARLRALQKEAGNRARPINTGQIEQVKSVSLADMLD